MKPELTLIESQPPGVAVKERLDEALAAVERGEVSSIALAVVYRDGSTGTCWSEAPSFSTLIGAVGRLHHRLVSFGDEE